MNVYLQKRGCPIIDDSPVIQKAKRGGITNHRYIAEISQPRKGREGKETRTGFVFSFHDWSTNKYARKHMEAQGLSPDKARLHTTMYYYDAQGMCWGVVKADGWINANLKAVQAFIRRHGYPDAEIQIQEGLKNERRRND